MFARRTLVAAGFLLVLRGSLAAQAPPGATGRCKDGTYTMATNRQGACSRHGGIDTWLVPPDATALCNDGTYSKSQHRRGTCSKHKGVKTWLKNLPA